MQTPEEKAPDNVKEVIETAPETPPAAPVNDTVTVTAGDLVGETPVEIPITVKPDIETTATVTPADLIEPAPAIPTGRTRIDYNALDWSKRNADLARECGVSPQYISQLRRKRERGQTLPISESAGEQSRPDFNDLTTLTPEKASVDYALMAATVFDMSTGTLSMIFGPEWQPKAPEERQAVVTSLQAYLTAKQAKDLPPGVILTFVCCAYAATRVTQPNTAGKLKHIWTWTKVKVGGFMLRFKRKPKIAVIPKPSED